MCDSRYISYTFQTVDGRIVTYRKLRFRFFDLASWFAKWEKVDER